MNFDEKLESEFLTVSFNFNDKIIKANLSEELRMDQRDNPDVISDHMNKLSGRIAFWGAVLAEAEYVLEKVQDDFEQWFAMSADAAVQFLRNGKPPSYQPTKDSILAYVLASDKEIYDTFQEDLRKAERDVRILRRSHRAFETRAEMLINIGANMRTQMKNIEMSTPDGDEWLRR
jgi:hypothetical protein